MYLSPPFKNTLPIDFFNALSVDKDIKFSYKVAEMH